MNSHQLLCSLNCGPYLTEIKLGICIKISEIRSHTHEKFTWNSLIQSNMTKNQKTQKFRSMLI